MDLVPVLQRLYDSEINVTITIFVGRWIRLRVGYVYGLGRGRQADRLHEDDRDGGASGAPRQAQSLA
jgi:hypothetical protein